MGLMPMAMPLEELEHLVARDFTKKVVVSHGLFTSPYPQGSLLVCEVDNADLLEVGLRREKEEEFVIQVIPCTNSSALLQLTESSRGQYHKVPTPISKVFKENEQETQSMLKEEVLSVSPSDLSTLNTKEEPNANDTQPGLFPAKFEFLVQALFKPKSSVLELETEGTDGRSVGIAFTNNKAIRNLSHPNIVPSVGTFVGEGVIYLVYPHAPYTLKSLLHYSPCALGSDWHMRLIVYELLSGLAHIHNAGISHGDLKASKIVLTSSLWCWITGTRRDYDFGITLNMSPKVNYCRDLSPPDPLDWRDKFKKWMDGELSNYDYLLVLNTLAGRRWGDRCLHTVMPWVIDFSDKPDECQESGWRDLTRSKWRLAKGDEQLDFTFMSAEVPHHVSDECLSELAVCIYKARRLPLLILRRVVRSVYEPNEYPANMQRLYQWTPDECIPEFYSDPNVFYSVHEGMNNLAVPLWAKDAEDFIYLHREALESERVSQQLHHWIDLTFGYKLSGESAVEAKNVTLSTSQPTVPRSAGRRQLFFKPHPRRSQRSKATRRLYQLEKISEGTSDGMASAVPHLLPKDVEDLDQVEENTYFCEMGRHLSPIYRPSKDSSTFELERTIDEQYSYNALENSYRTSFNVYQGFLRNLLQLDGRCLDDFLEYLKEQDNHEASYQSFMTWKTSVSKIKTLRKDFADDIFSVGCLIAEIYLQKPLFDPVSLAIWDLKGTSPSTMEQLPMYVKTIVEAAVHKEYERRPTAKMLLDSPLFPPAVHSAYDFLSALHSLSCRHDRLYYVARMAQRSAFLLMGPIAAELCTPSCLCLIGPPYQDEDTESITLLVKGLLKALKSKASERMLLPIIQILLQNHDISLLKLGFLQTSFIRELRKTVGMTAYMKQIHVTLLVNLLQSGDGLEGSAASIVLVDTCQELGLPITLDQTIMPLMQALGREITIMGIETLVNIGEQFGEAMITRHMLPALRSIITSGAELSVVEKNAPAQNWRLIAVVDAVAVLDRLAGVLSATVVTAELLKEPNNVYMKVLLQFKVNSSSLQCAAKALLTACQRAGAEATSVHVLPQLKLLFDDVAFGSRHETGSKVDPKRRPERNPVQLGDSTLLMDSNMAGKGVHSQYTIKAESIINDGMDLVYVLYPAIASFLGIEKLRQSIPAWLLLEQGLMKKYNWKWEGRVISQSKLSRNRHDSDGNPCDQISDFNPASLLLNGVGWSVPQSQLGKWTKPAPIVQKNTSSGKSVSVASISSNDEPWFWFPYSHDGWGHPESFSRLGAGHVNGDDHSWRLNATVIHSWRAHHSMMKTAAVAEDECTLFTAGTGSRGKPVVRKWDISTIKCSIEYNGHEEPVNDVCILPGFERVASCDGTLHIWNSKTAERIPFICKPSISTPSLTAVESNNNGHATTGAMMSNGILSVGLTGSLYTFMHYVKHEERLLIGTVNGCIRFIDVVNARDLFCWRAEPLETSFSSFISAISSSGSNDVATRASLLSSWVAVGFSSGHCSLLDYKTGAVLGTWRAHSTNVTKLTALDEHYLLSSSFDKTLCIWDLRKGWPLQPLVLLGHTDGISSFAVWGSNIISAAGSKIGLSSFSRLIQPGQSRQAINSRKLYTLDHTSRNLANITTISILPFSKLFLVGTDDGFLKICT